MQGLSGGLLNSTTITHFYGNFSSSNHVLLVCQSAACSLGLALIGCAVAVGSAMTCFSPEWVWCRARGVGGFRWWGSGHGVHVADAAAAGGAASHAESDGTTPSAAKHDEL